MNLAEEMRTISRDSNSCYKDIIKQINSAAKNGDTSLQCGGSIPIEVQGWLRRDGFSLDCFYRGGYKISWGDECRL